MCSVSLSLSVLWVYLHLSIHCFSQKVLGFSYSSALTGPCWVQWTHHVPWKRHSCWLKSVQRSFWTLTAVDLKVKDSHDLRALFYFLLLNFKYCFGLLPCSGCTVFSSPLGDEHLIELNSTSVNRGPRRLFPGPSSSCVSLTVSGELHLSQTNDCDQIFFLSVFKKSFCFETLLYL